MPSSDLQRARAIAQALTRSRRPRAVLPPPAAPIVVPDYAKFDVYDISADLHSYRPTCPVAEPDVLPELSMGKGDLSDPWTSLMVWMAAVTGGGFGFVMSADGLTLASSGFDPETDVDMLGARLVLTMEQANRMGLDRLDVRSLYIRFDNRWLSGVSVCEDDQALLTAGVLAHMRLPEAGVEKIARVLRQQAKPLAQAAAG